MGVSTTIATAQPFLEVYIALTGIQQGQCKACSLAHTLSLSPTLLCLSVSEDDEVAQLTCCQHACGLQASAPCSAYHKSNLSWHYIMCTFEIGWENGSHRAVVGEQRIVHSRVYILRLCYFCFLHFLGSWYQCFICFSKRSERSFQTANCHICFCRCDIAVLQISVVQW